ncbi:MAG: manganese efflux pump MntP family protein [Bacteroidales bacterium]|nr:manganese efflux pump MntP family protein [Bacteroidales bacterium]MCF8386515.1 manganese efflux pump MntP family protein [Bacteroidales bacterium]MCF8397081.1 manganese efflux pump MntP family protein [Bacteroidales bacterium]
MNYFEIILLSLALSLSSFKLLMDAAVEYCYKSSDRFRIALVFALFKSLLLLLGFWITSLFSTLVWESRYWIMIAIFLVLGLKMIFDAIKVKPGERSFQLSKPLILVLTALAANMDGFIAGIAFAFAKTEMLIVAGILFLFSLFVSWNALIYGEKKGNFTMASRVNISGGLLMIAYAMFIFFEKTGGFI